MNLTQRIELIKTDRENLSQLATKYHYLHRPVHQRSSPFGYIVSFDGKTTMPDSTPCGFIVFASIHFTKHKNLFGYDGLPTKWQVLSLARLWLHDDLPRNSETVVISKAIQPKGLDKISLAGHDWLQVHPPKYLDEPYHIRLIVSYADNTVGHAGTIYKASNFECLVKCEYCHANFYSTSKQSIKCPICGVQTSWQPQAIISESRHKNIRGSGCNGHILTQYVYRLPEPKSLVSVTSPQLAFDFLKPISRSVLSA